MVREQERSVRQHRKKQFYNINYNEQRTMTNRDEEVWRNDLAFIRHHLVLGKYIDGNIRDNWEVTQKGRIYFQSLLREVLVRRNFEKLTNIAIDKAKELAEK